MRNTAMDALVALIGDIKAAKDGRRDGRRACAGSGLSAKAQFLLDFIEAENSMGFHADQEAVRILGQSVNYTRLGQINLRDGAEGAEKKDAPEIAGSPANA